MNVRLLRKVKKHILEEPRRFQMSEGLRFADEGTVGCIAGWTCVLGDRKVDWSERTDWTDVRDRARALIGIENHTVLFRVSCWPEPFSTRYVNAKTTRTRAKIAAERIEHFIKTKGAE